MTHRDTEVRLSFDRAGFATGVSLARPWARNDHAGPPHSRIGESRKVGAAGAASAALIMQLDGV